MELSTQTYAYIVILTITSIINLITASVIAGGYGFLMYIVFFVITLPFVFLFIYNLNCLTTGNCNILSWIVMMLSAIYMVVTTAFMIIAATSVETHAASK